MKNTKKILFFTENVSWGGSEFLWSQSLIELSKIGFSIAVCIHEKLELPENLILLEKRNTIKIFRFGPNNLSFLKRILNRFLPYSKRFKRSNLRENFILKFNPDLLVVNQGFNFNGVSLMLFAVQNKINYITISHAVNESLWPSYSLRKNMQIGFNNSCKNYFVSMDNLLVTQNQLGVFLKNAEIVRNPFNVSFKIDLDFPETSDFYLAFVGRYDFYAKGQDVLLQVMALKKWKNRNLHINFYGVGNDSQNLKDLVEMYQLKNVKIHSHTATENIWKLNQGLILTSRFEGLPIVIVEAMLCKRLVIVTNVSGNTEFVVDNQTGFVAAAPRSEYVDEALERAWQQRTNWKEIGIIAKKQITNQIPENPALDFANKLQAILNNV